jgi:hypothetical protein
MPIFELTNHAITPVPTTTLVDEKIVERAHLQKVLRANIAAVAPDCYVIAEEYCEWADSKRRIDLLCIDADANLVVVELKRTEDGGHADLQAIRYAAMIHLMTFDDAVSAHAAYLKKNIEDARQSILGFLNWPTPREDAFAQDARIILVSGEFSNEVTSTAIWLNKKGLDVSCVRLRTYKHGESVLVDIQQTIPLPEAADYQIQLKKKEEEVQQSRIKKRPNFRFSMVGIEPGETLVLYNYPNETCVVHDDRLVKFRDEVMSLGRSAGIVLKEHGLSDSIAGTDYWMYKGNALSYLRLEAEKKNASGNDDDHGST